jgi:hypothetical protein
MTKARLSKVYFNKTTSNLDFTTEEYLIDSLKLLSAKSRLPIKVMLTILSNKQADTVSCSRDDTDYSFFASYRRDVISITVKKLGEEIIEFELPSQNIETISLQH